MAQIELENAYRALADSDTPEYIKQNIRREIVRLEVLAGQHKHAFAWDELRTGGYIHACVCGAVKIDGVVHN